jgi:hypothetical protein
VSATIVSEVGIEVFRSTPSDPLGCSRVAAGRFRVVGERSCRLHLRPREAFEIDDPPDQIGLLADPPQAPASEPASPVPAFALAEQLLDLLPTALRQAVAEAADAHSNARVRGPAVAGVHGNVRRHVSREQRSDERLAEEALVDAQRARGEAPAAARPAQQRQAAARLRGARAIDSTSSPSSTNPMGVCAAHVHTNIKGF